MCYSEISDHIINLFENSRYIIICLSVKSLKSHLQIIETNKILDGSFKYNNNKIIYLITDLNYYPFLVDNKINNNEYFPCYDQETLNYSFEKILHLL